MHTPKWVMNTKEIPQESSIITDINGKTNSMSTISIHISYSFKKHVNKTFKGINLILNDYMVLSTSKYSEQPQAYVFLMHVTNIRACIVRKRKEQKNDLRKMKASPATSFFVHTNVLQPVISKWCFSCPKFCARKNSLHANN